MRHCPRVIIADCATLDQALIKAGHVASPTRTVKIWRVVDSYAVYPGDFDLRGKATLVETVHV